MTDTEFRQLYQVLQPITEKGTRSHHARDSAGRAVLVHYFPDDSTETRRILASVDSTPDAARRVVNRLEVDGLPVLVTHLIPGFRSLTAWVQGLQETTPNAPATRRGGDMTQLFGPSADSAPVTPPLPVPPPAPPPTPVARGGRVDETVEVKALSPPPAPPKSPEQKPRIRWRETAGPAAPERPIVHLKKEGPPPARHIPAASPPPPAAAPVPPAPKGPAAPKAPGEMTQLFGAGGAPPQSADALARDAAKAPPSMAPKATPYGVPPQSEPGEFTRLFNPGGRPDPSSAPRAPIAPLTPPPSPPPATPPAAKQGEFTQMMGARGATPLPAASAPRDAPAVAPGEFTRMIKGLPRTADAPASAPAKAPASVRESDPAAEQGQRSHSQRVIVLVVGLGVLVVLIVGLVLYLVLRAP